MGQKFCHLKALGKGSQLLNRKQITKEAITLVNIFQRQDAAKELIDCLTAIVIDIGHGVHGLLIKSLKLF